MKQKNLKTYLGIDIGSLTIKFVLIDEKENVLYWSYERTGGRPIEALKNGLKKLKAWIEDHNPKVEISGVGTTGSARYLAGVVVGADLIKNEITAHAKGVIHFVPDARTVIEIGGQDSKIIILENGVVVDFALNLICVPENTKVITEGYIPKKINEIKVGEKVLTHLGRFKKVKEVFERNYQGEIIEIKVSKFRSLKLTPNHPVLALPRKNIQCYFSHSRNYIPVCREFNGKINCKKRCQKWINFSWEPIFIEAKDLRKGDFVAIPLSLENELVDPPAIEYSLVKTEIPVKKPFYEIEKFYFKPDLLKLLGYYLAKGNISYNRACGNKNIKYPCGIVFTFNIKEIEEAKEIKNIVEKNFPGLKITFFSKPKTKSLVVWVHSKSLAEYLKYLCGEKADKKRLSQELLNLEPFLQKEILKGFFKSGGQLRKRKGSVSSKNKKVNRYCVSTTSEILAHQLYWILLRNKIKTSLRKSSSKTKGGKWTYFIEIYGKEINKLEEEKIEQKKDSSKSFIYSNWLFEPILESKKSEFNGKVYNLSVETDNSYIANLFVLKNCSAGTGAFLDAQAFRLGIPVEKFGELALKSKKPTVIASRCSVFAESDMIHKQQIGHKIEDIVAGLCQGLARNYLSGVGKGKKILPPIVFLGGVSENVGMRWAFEKALGQKIIVPKYNTVMGAFGVALLVKEMNPQKTKFRGFEISDKEISCDSFQCSGCPNRCEVIQAKIEGKIVARWGDRCGRWSNLKYD